MTTDQIENRLRAIVAAHFEVAPSRVTADASFVSDLGADSLDTIEVVLEIEDEFGIEIPDADVDTITTFGQALGVVAKNLGVGVEA